MSEESGTLNDTGASSTPDTAGPAPEFVQVGDMVSTVEKSTAPVEPISQAGEQNTDVAPEKEDAAKDAEQVKADEKSVDVDRLDKHPRFQELIREKNELKNALAELESRVNQGPHDKPPVTPEAPGYEDVAALDAGDILDRFNEDPKGFLANFARQVHAEIKQDLLQQQAVSEQQRQAEDRERQTRGTFESYAKENADFLDMWSNGDIPKFMEENPGHNAISAHQVMTAQQRVDKAVKAAVKEAEQRVLKNQQLKRDNAVLGTTKAAPGRGANRVPPELLNPKAFGGATSVLAQRLAARNAQRGA